MWFNQARRNEKLRESSSPSGKGQGDFYWSEEAPDWWYEFFRPIVRVGWSLVYWVHYTGKENVPASGPVLVVCNHQSHFDPPLAAAPIRRRMWFFGRKSLFRFRPVGWFFRSLGGIPVDIEGSPLAGVKETLRQLRLGRALLIFPEGSRTWDGSLGPFRPGFAALARRSQAAIVPVAIAGAYEAWPRWRPFPRWGIMHVMYLPPLYPQDYASWDDESLIREVRRRIEEGLEKLYSRPILREWRRWLHQLGWDRAPEEAKEEMCRQPFPELADKSPTSRQMVSGI
jgi:1-acyl-sn-glycerol-3-phosphate acyltransferase